MKTMKYLGWLAMLSFATSVAHADIVHLKDGRKIEGEVIEKTADKVVVKTKYGTQNFKPSEVDRVEAKNTPEQELAARRAKILELAESGAYSDAVVTERLAVIERAIAETDAARPATGGPSVIRRRLRARLSILSRRSPANGWSSTAPSETGSQRSRFRGAWPTRRTRGF